MQVAHRSWSADQRELGARLQLSQARLTEHYFGAKDPRTYKAWAACVALTAGYGKVSDVVHVSTIEKLAGLAEGKGSKPLRELHDKGVIVWDKQAGQRTPGTLSLPPLPAEDDGDRQERPVDDPPAAPTQPAPDPVQEGQRAETAEEFMDRVAAKAKRQRDLDEAERLFGNGPTSDETDKERHGMKDRRRR